MHIPEVGIDIMGTLPIDKFREMDYASIEKYNIPIELLMENAGLNLARITTSYVGHSDNILIGIGPGNNGGGGLVAARRLAGWGYKVYLQLQEGELKPLPQSQLLRALAFGAKIETPKKPAVFIDAYLGFSQHLPLSPNLHKVIEKNNTLECKKISLDIPTGFNKLTGELLFKPDIILTLGAMKTELVPLLGHIRVFVGDLGLPHSMYSEFGIRPLPEFHKCGIVECVV